MTARGHWPAGKRRNPPPPAVLLEQVRTLLATRHTGTRPVRGVRVSACGLAAWCGVSDRAVRRWLSGEDCPPRDAVRRIRTWARRAARGEGSADSGE